MSLQTNDKIEKSINSNTREKPVSSNSDNDNQLATSPEDIAPSPKTKPKLNAAQNHSSITTKLNKNFPVALSTVFGNPVPINAISDRDELEQKPFRFEIDSPPDKTKTKG